MRAPQLQQGRGQARPLPVPLTIQQGGGQNGPLPKLNPSGTHARDPERWHGSAHGNISHRAEGCPSPEEGNGQGGVGSGRRPHGEALPIATPRGAQPPLLTEGSQVWLEPSGTATGI